MTTLYELTGVPKKCASKESESPARTPDQEFRRPERTTRSRELKIAPESRLACSYLRGARGVACSLGPRVVLRVNVVVVTVPLFGTLCRRRSRARFPVQLSCQNIPFYSIWGNVGAARLQWGARKTHRQLDIMRENLNNMKLRFL